MDVFKGLYHTMGPLRFFIFLGTLTIAIVGYGTIGWWLSKNIGWPDSYGFHCQGRGCLWIELYHSPQLLKAGRRDELILFAWMWLIPAVTAVTLAAIISKRWLRRRKDRIRPLY
jgi:hypothetical protein